jgi:hypothetical protein
VKECGDVMPPVFLLEGYRRQPAGKALKLAVSREFF